MENLSKKQISILVVIAIVICSVIGYYIYSKVTQQEDENFSIDSNNETIETKAEEKTEKIVVHIAGNVKNPGIVKIEEGARIADIIEAAGGLTEQADITNVNLAYIIEDGQKIIIPSKEEVLQEKEYISKESGDSIIQENEKQESIGGKIMVNINKAEQSELEQLQGIGSATAMKIIEYRKQNGNFNSIEDIKNVSGIGEAKFEAIKDNITVK